MPSPQLKRFLPATTPVQTASSALPAGLRCIGTHESRFQYAIVSPYGDGGAWQYQPGTWDLGDGVAHNGYKGYARAELAPPAVQDARALEDYERGPAVVHQLWPNTSRLCGV